MKIVFYDENKMIVDLIKDVVNPIVKGNEINWVNGSVSGFNSDYIILEDKIEIGEFVTDKMITFDKKNEFKELDEVAELKRQLQIAKEDNEMNSLAIMELTSLLLGGE